MGKTRSIDLIWDGIQYDKIGQAGSGQVEIGVDMDIQDVTGLCKE